MPSGAEASSPMAQAPDAAMLQAKEVPIKVDENINRFEGSVDLATPSHRNRSIGSCKLTCYLDASILTVAIR